MVPASVEISCGLQRDPVFGPVVAVGIGGVLIEIVGGTVLPPPPFQPAPGAGRGGQDRRRPAPYRQPRPVRGAGRHDRTGDDGLGTLALEIPEVESIDINPIRVDGDVAKAVDALLVVRVEVDFRKGRRRSSASTPQNKANCPNDLVLAPVEAIARPGRRRADHCRRRRACCRWR